MPYFEELKELPVYPRNDGDFRLNYNENSGGGQPFLSGRFINKDGELTSPEILDGKKAIFRHDVRTSNKNKQAIDLNDDTVTYKIKPRAEGATQFKLEVEPNPQPGKALTAFYMLPQGCGAGRSQHPQRSLLTKDNYWLQQARFDCEINVTDPTIVYLIPSDLVFSGGAANARRYFRLDVDTRIHDIIDASQKESLPKEILEPLRFFASVYTGTHSFTYDNAVKAVDTLMSETAKQYPTHYSGIDDPLPVLMTLNPARREAPLRYKTGLISIEPRNRIVFGAPGTGKSKLLNDNKDSLLKDGGEFERVTFHPDYSYAHFAGTYKPIPTKDLEGNETITYKYVAGPFMRVLAAALRNGATSTPTPHLLLIEEINRASPATVFGDVFQLLDRNDFNVSEYPINSSADVRTYLADTVGGTADDYKEIRLPDNMFIWGSMNSADQGVFHMDTAFKRRWDFTYVGIDDYDSTVAGTFVTLGKGKLEHKVEWNALRKSINNFLAYKGINEDKQIGPYFLGRKLSAPATGDQIDKDAFVEAFTQKVLMYLFEDAGRQHRTSLFEGCTPNANRYSAIRDDFRLRGVHIFNPRIIADIPIKSSTTKDTEAAAAATDRT